MANNNLLVIEDTGTQWPHVVNALGTANRISDAKGQSILHDNNLGSRNETTITCKIDGQTVSTKTLGEGSEVTKAVAEVVGKTKFALGNTPEQIMRAFSVAQDGTGMGGVIDPKNPKKLIFEVEGNVSPLDSLCALPLIRAVQAKGQKIRD